MKHEKLLTFLTAAVLSLVTACGAVGCLISAFDLNLEYALSPALVCGAAAVICAGALSFRRGGIALVCAGALLLGYLYRQGTAAEQLRQLILRLTTVYDRAYGWGVLRLTEEAWDAGFADIPVGIMGAVIALAVSRCVCRQTSVWPCVLSALFPLLLCIVVTDTVPGELWLLLMLAGLILLILTTSVRRENPTQGLRLTFAASVPVVLGLLGLFLAVPENSYVNQTEGVQEAVRSAVDKIPEVMEAGMNQLASRFQADPPVKVDLTGLGPRLPLTYTVMEVTAERDGTLYLRGQDYDDYDGLGWTATETRQESFSQTDGDSKTVTIRTANRKGLRFLPYYPAEETILAAGRAENDGAQEYTVSRTLLPEDWRLTAYGAASTGREKWPQYRSLPEDTRKGALEYLAGRLSDGASNTEKADIIAALVTDTAVYDLDPEKMPENAEDFALWFLREAESGYCVHFATAATVLLRAADVPARYVTGYLLEAKAGQTVTVTEKDAHAWAEYYEPNLDVWIPLEVTPGTEVAIETVPPETEATEPETTASTEPATEGTEPETTAETEPETLPPETVAATDPQFDFPELADSAPGRKFPVKQIFLLLLAAVLVPAQRRLRLRLRRKHQRTGSTNTQALRRWQETERLCRLLKAEPPEDLLFLAQKAKFSQYTLTAEELGQFDTFNRGCRKTLGETPWYVRWVYQYVLAVC